METLNAKRIVSLLMALLMVLTMFPVTVLSANAKGSYPVMMQFTAASSADFHRYYNKIVNVTFLDEIDYDAIDAALESWDISASSDSGTVMAWMNLNADATEKAGANRYDVYIAGDGGVGANPSSSFIFYGFSALEGVYGGKNFKTENATTMEAMFQNCNNLKYTDFTGWNTENVTSLAAMFRNCFALETLDLSSFNTSKVKSMRFMFYLCKELVTIYAGDGWTTDSLTSLYDGVFNCCYAKLGGQEEYEKNPNPPISAFYATFEEDGGYLTYKVPEAPEKFTVTYEFIGTDIPDGVSVTAPQEYDEGSTVYVSSLPFADGYEFSGWSTNDADISSASFVIENDVHIIGSWNKIKLYKVEFLYDESYPVPDGAPELPETEYYRSGIEVNVEDAFHLDAYIFVGWYTDDVYVSGNSFIMPEDDVILYGYFKKPVESVEIVKNGDITINYGDESKIKVNVKPDDATVKDIIFETSDDSIVTVDKDGNIKAVGDGTATITVYSKDDPTKGDSIQITVKIPVSDITVENNEFVLTPGDTDRISATVTPEEATDKQIYYISDDESVVTVDNNGNITAVSDGKTTISVISKDNPNVKETVTVTVKTPVTDITASDDFTLNIFDEKNVDASVNEDATNKELIYESSDPSVAKVDTLGNITAVGEGTTTITIISKDNPGITKTLTVTVKIPVDEIEINKDNIELIEGKTDKIEVTVKPGHATNKEVTFSSSDETVVKIDENGNVEAIGNGDAVITVTSKDDPDIYVEIPVKVNKPVIPVDEIKVNKDKIELTEGETDKIEVTVTPDDATNKEVTFSSSDETVVKVDENGNVEAIGEGDAVITVTSKDDPDIYVEIPVKVNKPVIPVDEINVNKDKIELTEGETDKLEVTVTPDDATNKDVTFSSSDETVVKVDENGNVEAIGDGDAVITVTSKDDPDIFVEIPVKVNKPVIPVDEIKVNKDKIELTEGETDKIEVTVTPDDATNKEVTFSSSDETVVKVDKNGNIEAVGEGEAVITVTSKDKSEVSVNVTIKVSKKSTEPEEPDEPDAPDYSVIVPDSICLIVGESKSLEIQINPDDGCIVPVFKSNNENIVKIDADGKITAVAIGSATISVDLGNGDIRIINVTVLAIPDPPRKHYICFGKTDGIGWYEVSVNGGDFFPQGPNSTLEVDEGAVLVIRIQDMWIDDEFDFYVNGKRIECEEANTITVVVDGYMLIGALSMDMQVPDVEESLSLLEKIIQLFNSFINWLKSLFS